MLLLLGLKELTFFETWSLPTHTPSFSGVTGVMCYFAIPPAGPVMATWLTHRAVQSSGRWLLPCPAASALLLSRGTGGTPSPSVALPSSRDKVRTAEDLPRVTMLEMLYRMVFQGYYNRLHELQVQQAYITLHCS